MTAEVHPLPTARRQRGFTLIEIMVVIVILGILAALVVPNIVGRTDDARVAKAKQDIQGIMTALNLYRLDNYQYPSTQQGLEALVAPPQGDPPARNWKAGGYLPNGQAPKDPWGFPYQYLNPGTHGEVDIFSLGRDGKPGGDGPDADIGNWTLSN